jgi:hypothetical protein
VSKREADARQLSGALTQLEVAEAALRDSQATAARLLQVRAAYAVRNLSRRRSERSAIAAAARLAAVCRVASNAGCSFSNMQTQLKLTPATTNMQDCTNLQRDNRRLGDEEAALRRQLHGGLHCPPAIHAGCRLSPPLCHRSTVTSASSVSAIQPFFLCRRSNAFFPVPATCRAVLCCAVLPAEARAEAEGAAEQVRDLQATLDSVLTELHIARSVLENRRAEEERRQAELEEGAPPSDRRAPLYRQLAVYPARIGSLRFDPEVGLHSLSACVPACAPAAGTACFPGSCRHA